MNENNISAEYRLNAMADGELDTHETEELLNEIRENPGLQRELCDIHLVKDMLKAAYPEQTKSEPTLFQRSNLLGAIAASFLILTIGFLAGNWLTPATLDNGFALSMVDKQPNKIVLHIGSSDDRKFTAALDKAEQLLKNYSDQNIQVDIVTSAGGTDLLRTKTSTYIQKVSLLAKSYNGLEFVACNNTLARLKQEGKDTDVIPDALIAPSAVQYVVKRLQQGWSYVAI